MRDDSTDAGVQPETAALRRLLSAGSEAELALARRMRLNPRDIAALSHVSFAPAPLGPMELSGRLGITPAAGTELVDRLQRAGHVERHRDEHDRRRVQLRATESATREVRSELAPLLEALDGVVADFDERERAAVLRYLDAVRRAYDHYSATDPLDRGDAR